MSPSLLTLFSMWICAEMALASSTTSRGMLDISASWRPGVEIVIFILEPRPGFILQLAAG